jgi:hypothetical protein
MESNMSKKKIIGIMVIILLILWVFLLMALVTVRTNKYSADDIVFGMPFHSYKYMVARIISFLPIIFFLIVLYFLVVNFENKVKKYTLVVVAVIGLMLSLFLPGILTPW